MLETVRIFAAEKLVESGEELEIELKHLEWCLDFASQAALGLNSASIAEQVDWQARLDVEHDNMRSALRWSIERGSDPCATLRLCGDLGRYWARHGNLGEARNWLDTAIGRARNCPPNLSAKAHFWAGYLAYIQGAQSTARKHLETALEANRTAGRNLELFATLDTLAHILERMGEYKHAERIVEEELALARELDDRSLVAKSVNLGMLACDHGDYERAEVYFAEALEVFREVGDARFVVAVLHGLGDVAIRMGDPERCVVVVDEGLRLAQEQGHTHVCAYSYLLLGNAAKSMGDLARAHGMFREALAIGETNGDLEILASVFEGLAQTATLEEDAERALRLAGAASALRLRCSSPLPPRDQSSFDRALEPARFALGEEGAERAFAAGSGITIDEVIALARDTASR
jgi:tetratricopeptide (TPR) repeat protein